MNKFTKAVARRCFTEKFYTIQPKILMMDSFFLTQSSFSRKSIRFSSKLTFHSWTTSSKLRPSNPWLAENRSCIMNSVSSDFQTAVQKLHSSRPMTLNITLTTWALQTLGFPSATLSFENQPTQTSHKVVHCSQPPAGHATI